MAPTRVKTLNFFLSMNGSGADTGRRAWWQVGRASLTAFLLQLTGCATFFREPVRRTEPLPSTPVVDMHCHVAGLGGGQSGCFVSQRLRQSWKFGFYLRSFGVSRRELEERGDAVCVERLSGLLGASRHVSRAVVLALDGVIDELGQLDVARTEVYVPNEFVAEAARRYPNLLFGASINPHRTNALARLEWAAAHGACLVKWLPSIQLIDPADERLTPFYRRLAELGLPLLVHTGREHSFTWSKDEYGDPGRLRLPLRLGVTVIAAHAAWPGRHQGERDVDSLARLMTQYPNLYTDISSLTQINKLGALREVLRRPEFHGRLVYGTDFPLINMPIVSAWFFPWDLKLSQRWRISRLTNPWDRDVALKQALGVPADVFARWPIVPAFPH